MINKEKKYLLHILPFGKDLGKGLAIIAFLCCMYSCENDLAEVSKFIDNEEVAVEVGETVKMLYSDCLLYTSPSPRDRTRSRMPSSA